MSDHANTLSKALQPIQESLDSIKQTLVSHAGSIKALEDAASDHSDRIVTLENKCESLRARNAELMDKLDDLENRSRRANLRVIGIPEKLEGDNAVNFMTDLLFELAFLSLLDQDEGFPARPRGRQLPPPRIDMAQGPRSTPGFLESVPQTVRFQWRNTEAGDAFPDRVPFIREVLFGALGLGIDDLVCAQRNNAARFFDVAMSSEEVYQRVLERGVDVSDHPLGKKFDLYPLGHNGRRMVTVHLFNPFVTAEVIRTFLRRYGEVQPGETMVRDELGIWNGRRQFMVEFREDGKGGLTHPPAYFSLDGNKGYLFYRGAGVGPVVPRTVGEEGPTGTGAQGSIELSAPAAAIATSSPGAAEGPAPGPHPLAGKEAPPISRPAKRARKRRRAQGEEIEQRQRAGSPGAAPEGAPLSPPVPPKLEDISVLVGEGTPPPPLTYGGKEVPPNEAAYLDGLESVGGDEGGQERGSSLLILWRD
ncbi:hypothetical protein MHYP_G00294910 [Metynnis hypsauchen]